jgi:hypothetical protein
MDYQARLFTEWLEDEGARLRLQLTLPPQVRHPVARGLVQLWVCVLTGTFVAGLFVCALATAWHQAGHTDASEKARVKENYETKGELETFNVKLVQ